jgi:hypothetical protein
MDNPDEKVVCFQCGQPVAEEGPSGAPLLNEVEEGVPCSACAERLLEQLPPIFHTPWTVDPARAESAPDQREEA